MSETEQNADQNAELTPSADLSGRYARNVARTTEKLRSASVGICGCGGLGSNIAIALARVGVGNLLLIDFDTVEASNLNRQQFFEEHIGQEKTKALKWMISKINSECNVTTQTVKITAENVANLLKDVDIICEAFDNPESKAVLASVSRTDPQLCDKPYVGGSGMAGIITANSIQTNKVRDNFYIAGDLVNSAQIGGGLMAPRVIVCAGHQANMIVRLICEETAV